MNKKLSSRDIFMVTFLLILLIGVCYYMFFLTPLKSDLTNLQNQINEANTQLDASAIKAASMNKMQAELDEILSRPANEITEIAPYDNAKVLMNELNGIFAQGSNYSVSFSDPAIGEDGIVRRSVQLSFSAADYDSAKAIIEQLENNHWRCLVTDLSMGGDIDTGSVNVQVNMLFFESTNLS